jgi:RNA polymerase sigma factor (sigma-70 family)
MKNAEKRAGSPYPVIGFLLVAVFTRRGERMSDAPITQPSLLVRIRDPRDGRSWSQFVDLYAPLVYRCARKHGLQDADAADFTQEILRAVAGAIGKFEYDPRRGSFRGWLFTVVRNRLGDFLVSGRRQCQGSGDTQTHALLEQQQDLSDTWDQDYEWQLLTWAAEQIRGTVQPLTWQAFWQTTIEEKSGHEVAAALGMTVAAVYLAKSRIMARLKDLIEQVQADWSDS